jgi:hypothetical protein
VGRLSNGSPTALQRLSNGSSDGSLLLPSEQIRMAQGMPEGALARLPAGQRRMVG